MFRGAIDAEAQDMRRNFGFFEDKTGDSGPAGTQLLMFWLAICKDDDCRLSRHLDDMCVVLGTDGVVNFSQASLIGAAISECVRHDDATIPPRLCKPATLGHSRIIAAGIFGARIHQNDTRRLIRALEVFELTGKTISSLQTDWQSPADLHHAIWIGLNWDKSVLNHRINIRVQQMMAAGWLAETRSLLDRFDELSLTAGKATGYAELIEHLHGKYSLDEAVEQIKIATRQLARRQMKWFRRFPNVHWIKGDRPMEQILSEILAIAAAAKTG